MKTLFPPPVKQSAAKVANRGGALLDNLISRIISRKFLVWLTGSYFAFKGLLEGDNGFNWIIVSCVYIGTESVVDYVVRIKGIKNNNTNTYSQPIIDIEEPTLENAKK